MSKNCVICGKRIGNYLFDVCNDYCLGIKEGRKQGALEELKRTYKDIDILWSKVSLDLMTASKIKDILYKRLKEFEEGSAKTKGFLESPRKKLGDVEK